MAIRCDVVVLGSGFAGLMSARQLARFGYRVVLIERAGRILAGASGHNEGWLHAGTYHAISIQDRQQARIVAARCIAGYRRIRREFPDCVEPQQYPTVAVVRHESLAETLSRWDAAEVWCRPASGRGLTALRREVSILDTERAFLVADRGIDTTALGACLAHEFRRDGGSLLVATNAVADGDSALRLSGPMSAKVRYRFLVCATGFATRSACASLGLAPPPIRLWRSHLASLPRLAASSVFALAPGEAAMVNHRERSVVGLNEDALLVTEPTFVPHRGTTVRLADAIRVRFPGADLRRAAITACVKVDVLDTHPARSLNLSTVPLAENAVCVLPGKMTEAPIAADMVADHVVGHLGPPNHREMLRDTPAQGPEPVALDQGQPLVTHDQSGPHDSPEERPLPGTNRAPRPGRTELSTWDRGARHRR
ncbi:MAG: hypothetical protein QOI74_3511 [Micromonosporaceae bacterium]|jgi:glycine/D-amino acid oxidase-like deaminating enzyme|nr:hypothetical protein [Micromonosporaceae bacterium]